MHSTHGMLDVLRHGFTVNVATFAIHSLSSLCVSQNWQFTCSSVYYQITCTADDLAQPLMLWRSMCFYILIEANLYLIILLIVFYSIRQVVYKMQEVGRANTIITENLQYLNLTA